MTTTAKLKIYGKPASRVFRVVWCASELDLDFELIPITSADGSISSPEYLAINPNGKIPAIIDGQFALWESQAINFYLVGKYDSRSEKGLRPRTSEANALALQWSFWAMAELDGPFVTIMWHRANLPKPQRDAELANRAEASMQAPLMILDEVLAPRGYLAGDRFGLADLNVAGILSWAVEVGRLNLAPFPNVARWLKACYDRPAAIRVDPVRAMAAKAKAAAAAPS